ncbi:uncharacterized protein LOC127862553 [Dreissena polymorpha]|uniref:J domain-containing protein n=1 Tax=Dreissena polymorpha TaxID=45954 RepID=A0A9D4BM97_DREPO|nr:uncharacterized protein LOC127862553 [Dreissena polymorpha]XP_052257683.1 uncharacterized protein LOC127862553 [Dreissena polymorpha]KAH3698288.1 hypothetical protein DPMN_085807 [Dreissena polymorpha]
MGQGHSKIKLSDEKVDFLTKETTFPSKTIKRWYKAYMVAFPDGMMDKDNFEKVYSECVPKGNPGLFKERAFCSRDRIDFDFFVLTIHKTSSAIRDENALVKRETTATTEALDFTTLAKEICENLRQWVNGEISGEACINSIIEKDANAAIGSFVGGKVGGAIGGPSGAAVGAVVAHVLPITAQMLKSKLKQWIFGCSKEKALEQAFTFVGLQATATNKEINSRYRKLARKYHPDKKGELEKWIQLQYSMELIRESRR